MKKTFALPFLLSILPIEGFCHQVAPPVACKGDLSAANTGWRLPEGSKLLLNIVALQSTAPNSYISQVSAHIRAPSGFRTRLFDTTATSQIQMAGTFVMFFQDDPGEPQADRQLKSDKYLHNAYTYEATLTHKKHFPEPVKLNCSPLI